MEFDKDLKMPLPVNPSPKFEGREKKIKNTITYSLNFIACFKCSKSIGKERIYINGNKLCFQCGSMFGNAADKRIVISSAWASLSELVQKLSVLNDDEIPKNSPVKKKLTRRRKDNSASLGNNKRFKSDGNCAVPKDETSIVNAFHKEWNTGFDSVATDSKVAFADDNVDVPKNSPTRRKLTKRNNLTSSGNNKSMKSDENSVDAVSKDANSDAMKVDQNVKCINEPNSIASDSKLLAFVDDKVTGAKKARTRKVKSSGKKTKAFPKEFQENLIVDSDAMNVETNVEECNTELHSIASDSKLFADKVTGAKKARTKKVKSSEKKTAANETLPKEFQENLIVDSDAMNVETNVKECNTELNSIAVNSTNKAAEAQNTGVCKDKPANKIEGKESYTNKAPLKDHQENLHLVCDSMDIDEDNTPSVVTAHIISERIAPSDNSDAALPISSPLVEEVWYTPRASAEPTFTKMQSCRGLMNPSCKEEKSSQKHEETINASLDGSPISTLPSRVLTELNDSVIACNPENEASSKVLDAMDETNRFNLLKTVLKDGIEDFFKNGMGVSILKQYTDDSPPIIDQSFPSDSTKPSFNKIIQSELQYFFQCEGGSKLLKRIITEAIQCLIDSKLSAGEKDKDIVIENEEKESKPMEVTQKINSEAPSADNISERIENTQKSNTEAKSAENDKNNDVPDLAVGNVLRIGEDPGTNIGLLLVPDSKVSDSEYESDNDMFVPPTPPVNNEISVFTSVMVTSISVETREILKQFVTFFNLKLHDRLFSETDCLIADQLTYTHKWLYARCKGIPVINSQWMVDSLRRGQLLPVSQYLFEPSFSIPNFFKELDIIVCPPYSDLSDSDYMKLWTMAGARASLIKNWMPGPVDLKRIIVVDIQSLILDADQLESRIRYHRAPVVTHAYIMKMLTEGVVDFIENHLILKISREDLNYMGFPCQKDITSD